MAESSLTVAAARDYIEETWGICLNVPAVYRYVNDPSNPLPHIRVGGRIYLRASAIDRWIEDNSVGMEA